jgi:7-cyano-7-deazaguanine synthase
VNDSVEEKTDRQIAVLASGGLDSCILIDHLARQHFHVQPIHIQTDVVWAKAEWLALQKFLAAISSKYLLPAVALQLPLADVYGNHWSVTGRATPDESTPDEAVFLPARNALLLIKAAVWCQLRGIGRLALAPLGTSPFEDASDDFLRKFEAVMNRSCPSPIQIERPFGNMTKRDVMELGRNAPLELTFSCIHPVDGGHCGACNKCFERKQAFAKIGLPDRTSYRSESE